MSKFDVMFVLLVQTNYMIYNQLMTVCLTIFDYFFAKLGRKLDMTNA